eukprot:gb/GECH01009095.1/.p1 GENE.gb/GECH01009095.1/~~gb/GECH01009095.1/.p1  ORF type:complete len:274 (+),score=73.43 gb/GECH01009095.1/:1-822(+)
MSDNNTNDINDILFFDLETDSLMEKDYRITREEKIEALNISVAVGIFNNVTFVYFKNPHIIDIDSLSGSVTLAAFTDIADHMDAAKYIVIQNHSFDFGVLQKYFPEKNIDDWHRKCFDFYEYFRSAIRRAIPLASLAQENDLNGKTGQSKDAPTLFKEGKLRELTDYCRRDVELLIQLYIKRRNLTVPIPHVRKQGILGVVRVDAVEGIVILDPGPKRAALRQALSSQPKEIRCLRCATLETEIKCAPPGTKAAHDIDMVIVPNKRGRKSKQS